jgi:hypothetical protein
MKNPGLPEPLWSELDGGLWHATGIPGLAGIAVNRRIRVSSGSATKTPSRIRGCVSLFDLESDAEFHDWIKWLNPHARRCAYASIGSGPANARTPSNVLSKYGAKKGTALRNAPLLGCGGMPQRRHSSPRAPQ